MAGPNKQQGSYIDLKNCTILLEDGYLKTGAVNLMAGYMIGATSIVVDGLPALTVLPVGARVTFAGDTEEYYIASTIETSNLTTTIVLDHGLVAALVDNVVMTVGPQCLEIKLGDGTLTYSETKNREYKLNRGIIDKVRNGDQAPMDVATTFAWTHITSHSSETIPSVEDCLKNRGLAATWVSTGQGCDPFAVNLVIKNSPLVCVGETHTIEKVVFPEFRYEKLDHDAKAGTVSLSGKCNATEPTVTRI
jgi:hypothetical protein